MLESKTRLKVRFAETDAMGVVYHANYLEWCEMSRVDMMNSIGMPYSELIKMGYHLPVFEAHLNYKYPAKFDDDIEVTAKIAEMPSVKIRVDYEIRSGDRLLVSGYTMHAFVNLKGVPVKPPRNFLEKLSEKF